MTIINKNDLKTKGKWYTKMNTITYRDLKEELGELYSEFSTFFEVKISDSETHLYNKCSDTGIWIKGISKLEL